MDDCFEGYSRKLQETLDSEGIADRFIFTGFRQDMPSVYEALDVVAFPASSEGFGRIVIEAGAARRPVVGNDIPVMREILSNDGKDFVVDCDKPDLFADKIVQLLKNPELRKQSADRLHTHVSEKFSLDVHLQSVLDMYAEVTSFCRKTLKSL